MDISFHNRFSLWTSLGVFALLLGGTGVRAQSSGDRPLSVVVARVDVRTEFGERLEALGTSLARESVLLKSNVTEFAEEILFDDGDVVEEGQVLLRMRDDGLRGELKAAKATYDERKSAFERARELVERQAVSSATLQEREAALRQVEGQIEEIESRIRDRTLKAPFSGVLGIRRVSPGALISAGETLTTLDDLTSIRVEFDAPSLFLNALRPGMELEAESDAFRGETFTGTLSHIDTRIDPVTRTLRARANFPNEDGRLRPGLLMRVNLTKNQREARLIPEGAIIQRGRESFVFRVAENGDETTVEERKVTLGTRIPGWVEAASGLDAEDRVVVHGLMQVRDGVKVRILGEWTGDEPLASFLDRKNGNNGRN
ncbi:MAG: efflux RND transporter periplasmic adaptor subunit [Verrucomicrobia bacterium]|nr:efflux RND transporter periplasmic adaptor subunit [Verrucomicrobiota bacterium]MCH8528320.1 efflux RND transporter periplasmic adaptor subunit [Kiritimatiellia bacterium]